MEENNNVQYNRRASDKEKTKKGLSLRALNYIMSGVTFTVSVLMLVSAYFTSKGYSELKTSTENYIVWEQSAEDLIEASDYLTEQARSFAVTGDVSYMENYFKEANETKRRDKALEVIRESLRGSQALIHLQNAMKKSVDLMQREYYAMRLAISAFGLDINSAPEEIKNVTLDEKDAALSKDEQEKLACMTVFDDVYKEYKETIMSETQKCVGDLALATRQNMEKSFSRFTMLMTVQWILIIVLVITVITVILLTSIQIINPLVRAVPNIKDEKPLSVDGAYEYRFLAKTYNHMYKVNKQQKSRLKYEATHDVLTGALNRNGYEVACKSSDLENYALVVVDLDNFKMINDTYGHPTGDSVLIRVANEIRRNFRSSDYICRVGGDEFVLIINKLKDTPENREAICKKLQRINDAIRSKDEGLPETSVSAGAAFGESCDDSVETAKKADSALYEVKQGEKGGLAFYREKERPQRRKTDKAE